MRVAIIGTGYVGLVSGVCLAAKGHEVICVDQDPAKVEAINNGKPPIHENGLDQLLQQTVKSGALRAVTDLNVAIIASEITLIAVGTPFDGSAIDLEQIRTAAHEIGGALAKCPHSQTVVVKSTVVPGTTEDVVLPILEEASGLRAGVDFGVGMNPEFLKEGDAVADFMNPDRIVMGGIDKGSVAALEALYAPFSDVDKILTTPRTAEMIKYAANALLATLISFSNEIGNICEKINVDVTEALGGVHLDGRFSPIQADGQRVWPTFLSYLEAGCGFGGSCFPKDVKALISFGEAVGAPVDILSSVIAVNEAQPYKLVGILQKHFDDLAEKRIAILGLAFKPGTDDIRESPALDVVRELISTRATVIAYDPIARENAEKVLTEPGVIFAQSLSSAVEDVDAVVIVTRWPEFNDLPDLLRDSGKQPLVVDGRRMLPKDSVKYYDGIGLGG